MATTVEVSIPPDAFALGCVFEEHPAATIEFEPIVPVGEDLIPYFWLSNGDLDAAAATIRDHPGTKSLTELTRGETGALFEMEWEPTVDRAVGVLREDHSGCLKATGTADGWELRLRFADHENVVAFNRALTEEGIPVTLNRLSDFSRHSTQAGPSREQREALGLAYEHGYFEVPRECTISELADEAGISNSAFSERLRRGVAALLSDIDVEEAASTP